MSQLMMKRRIVRYALVAGVTAAVSFPLVSQRLRAQDEPTAPAAEPEAASPEDDEAAAASQDEPGARPEAEPQAADPAADPAAAPDKPDKPRAPGAPGARPRAGRAAPAAVASAADPGKVIASAGDLEVTVGDVEAFIAGVPPQQQAEMQAQLGADPQGKRQLVEHLLKMKVLAREAEQRKLHEEPRLRQQLNSVRTQILAEAMVSSLQGDDAADKTYFEEHKDEFGKVKARHVLVATRPTDPNSTKKPLTDEQAKKKADDIRARLVKGEDFAALAKAESDDTPSKSTGGEYTFGRGRMVPEFEKAAYGLKENEISQPVKTQHGYHVIQLLARLPGTFEEARPEIGRQRLEGLIKEWMGGEPKFDKSFFAAGPRPDPFGGADTPVQRPAGEKRADKPGNGDAAPKGAK